MYNKTKRILDMICAGVSIALGSVFAISFLLRFIGIFSGKGGVYFGVFGIGYLWIAISAAFAGVFIASGASGFIMPKKVEGVWLCRNFGMGNKWQGYRTPVKKNDIVILVVTAIALVLSGIFNLISIYFPFILVLSLAIIGLKIGSLCIKIEVGTPENANNASAQVRADPYAQYNQPVAQGNSQSIETKVAELKHLKDIGVISEAQYTAAVQKSVQELAQPIAQPVERPAFGFTIPSTPIATTPVQEPVAPVAQPIEQPVVQPVETVVKEQEPVQPVVEESVQPVAQTTAQPFAKPIIQPIQPFVMPERPTLSADVKPIDFSSTAQPAQPTNDKVAELKRLKDLGVITEEQYNAAIQKL